MMNIDIWDKLDNLKVWKDIDAGTYEVVTNAGIKETKDGQPVLSFTHKIHKGTNDGRLLFDDHYIINKKTGDFNEVAARIFKTKCKNILGKQYDGKQLEKSIELITDVHALVEVSYKEYEGVSYPVYKVLPNAG